jgi:DNA-binding NarL/FixJ family response regulator
MASPETNPVSPQTSGSIRVVVADDHPIVRSGIKAELDAATGIEVVGEATDGKQVLSQVTDLAPDVLLLDINMPGMRALAVMRDLAHLPSPPHVLVLTVERDIECVIAMLKAGATGYLVKDEHPCTIVDGVRAVAKGESWLSQAVLSIYARKCATFLRPI